MLVWIIIKTGLENALACLQIAWLILGLLGATQTMKCKIALRYLLTTFLTLIEVHDYWKLG